MDGAFESAVTGSRRFSSPGGDGAEGSASRQNDQHATFSGHWRCPFGDSERSPHAGSPATWLLRDETGGTGVVILVSQVRGARGSPVWWIPELWGGAPRRTSVDVFLFFFCVLLNDPRIMSGHPDSCPVLPLADHEILESLVSPAFSISLPARCRGWMRWSLKTARMNSPSSSEILFSHYNLFFFFKKAGGCG